MRNEFGVIWVYLFACATVGAVWGMGFIPLIAPGIVFDLTWVYDWQSLAFIGCFTFLLAALCYQQTYKWP